jgi:hypothetical protein
VLSEWPPYPPSILWVLAVLEVFHLCHSKDFILWLRRISTAVFKSSRAIST